MCNADRIGLCKPHIAVDSAAGIPTARFGRIGRAGMANVLSPARGRGSGRLGRRYSRRAIHRPDGRCTTPSKKTWLRRSRGKCVFRGQRSPTRIVRRYHARPHHGNFPVSPGYSCRKGPSIPQSWGRSSVRHAESSNSGAAKSPPSGAPIRNSRLLPGRQQEGFEPLVTQPQRITRSSVSPIESPALVELHASRRLCRCRTYGKQTQQR